MPPWEEINWIKDFAKFFNLPVRDVKLVYEVYLGNRVNDWPHPFGEIDAWVNDWDSEENKKMRNAIVNEKKWTWESTGAKLLQNEIYRRTPGSEIWFQGLADIVLFHQVALGRDISVLDYGCGTANFIEYLIGNPNISITLLDVDPICIEYCRHKYRSFNNVVAQVIPHEQRLSLDLRVVTSRYTINGKHDFIFAVDVLEHTLNPLSLTLEITRSLNPQGMFAFIFPDNIEGTWHTPEANYLRPLCLSMINSIYTKLTDVVHQKNVDPLVESITTFVYTVLERVMYPFAIRFGKKYISENNLALK